MLRAMPDAPSVLEPEGVLVPVEKKAAFDDMPWVTAGRAPKETTEVPDKAYQDYLRDVLGADLRRSRFFDVAGGTRTPGVLGALGAGGRSTLVGQELISAGINPLSSKVPSGFANAFKQHLGDSGNVENLFGSTMGSAEALATLGPLGILTASRDAGDPASWAKAFGNAAKTPAEQQAMRKRLHAVMSLHATKKALKDVWNTTRLGEAFGKTPFTALSQYPRAHRGFEVGPEGWQSKPLGESSIPVLDPKYFPDNDEAARVAAKYGSFDKYARELNGDWPTAKDPNDKSEHLYHTVKKDGKVSGMVKVKPYIDGFQISNLWIRPESRSSGVGTGLMQRVIKHYGDKKLYLTAEIFDNSPITQEQLETWYKKFGFVGSHEGKMSRPANTKTAAEDTRPYRNRVEIFAVDDLKVPKVYGGKFKTGGFGVFGGGTDGDALEEAAKREFLQETGYKLTSVEKIPVDPVTVEWSKPYKSEKQAERAKTYRGTRTWYLYGIIEGEKAEKAKGEDGQSPLTDVGFYTVDTAMKLLTAATTENAELVPQIEARKRALFFVLAKAYGVGLTKIACDVPSWAKKNPKLLKALSKKLKKTANSKLKAQVANADPAVLAEILAMLEKKTPRHSGKPKRTRNVKEVLGMALEKQAADKEAKWMLDAARRGIGGLRHGAGVVGRGVSMAGRMATPRLSNFRTAYAGAPNPAKSIWEILSGKAKTNLAWRQGYLNKLQREIPTDVRKAEGAMKALQQARNPKVRQHILNNLDRHRIDLQNQRHLAEGMGTTQRVQMQHYGQLDPSLQRYAHPGVPGIGSPQKMNQVETQWSKPAQSATRTQTLPAASLA